MWYFINAASFLIVCKEIQVVTLEYGPMNMALKLKQRQILDSHQHQKLSELNINDYHKSLVLVNYILDSVTLKHNFEQFKAFMNSEEKLWHVSLRMTQIC